MANTEPLAVSIDRNDCRLKDIYLPVRDSDAHRDNIYRMV